MITIEHKQTPTYDLKINDIMDGRAYESQHGLIYIGNAISFHDRQSQSKAFSICGNSLLYKDDGGAVREVNLRIIVE